MVARYSTEIFSSSESSAHQTITRRSIYVDAYRKFLPGRYIHGTFCYSHLRHRSAFLGLFSLLNCSASVQKNAKYTNDFFDKTKLVYVPKDIQCIPTEKLTTSANFGGENLGMTVLPINNICFRLNEYGS